MCKCSVDFAVGYLSERLIALVRDGGPEAVERLCEGTDYCRARLLWHNMDREEYKTLWSRCADGRDEYDMHVVLRTVVYVLIETRRTRFVAEVVLYRHSNGKTRESVRGYVRFYGPVFEYPPKWGDVHG